MPTSDNDALKSELLEVQRTLGWMDLVIGNITDAVYVTDQHDRLVFTNQYFSDIVGQPRVFLLGRNLYDVFDAELKNDPNQQFISQAQRDSSAAGAASSIYAWNAKDQLKIFKISSSYIDTIRQTVFIAKDITAEYEISIMKSNFINIASHQLRTPMTAIMTYSHMLHEGYGGELDAKQMQLTERLVVSSERMISLINDILLISRLQNGEENLIEKDGTLGEVFAALEVELRPKIVEKQLLFDSKYTTSVKDVPCSKFLVHEILSNLLTNGIQYTPKKGKISIHGSSTANGLQITIADSGIGIPQDYIPKIFEQFSRAENAFKVFNEGTGLGLYVVRIIADLLKANITCTSQVNKGTTFTVNFPR